MTALSVQFEGTDGVSLMVGDLVTSSSPKEGTSGAADQIWRWKDSEWRKYFYAKYNKQSKQDAGWCLVGDKTNTTDRVSPGETFFFVNKSAVAVNLTASGAVVAFKATPKYTVAPSENALIGYPWPVELPIAGFEAYQFAPKQGTSGAADQIWRWQNSEWRKYFYAKYNKQSKQDAGWCLVGDKTNTTDKIAVGEGFSSSTKTPFLRISFLKLENKI